MIKAIDGFQSDHPEPTECTITGSVPSWVRGSLIRSGPGRFKYGPDEAKHAFDGMSVIHRYSIEDGKVKYHNRFLNSYTFQRNEAANRIVMTEFGTLGAPDPCKSIFTRHFTYYFESTLMTDNDCVSVMELGDQIYAMTETPLMNKVDPETLDRVEQVDWRKYVAVHMATAHPVKDHDGTTYSMGTSIGGQSYYIFVKIPPPKPDEKEPLETATLVGRIPSQWPRYPNYFHSFGMTENYFVFIEQPAWMNFLKRLTRRFIGHSVDELIKFKPDQETKIHLVNKRTGERLNTEYRAPAMFTFHHINAYEESGQVIFDVSGYKDCALVRCLTLEELRKDEGLPLGYFTRFVLPLKPDKSSGSNLVDLPDCLATATAREDGTIFCVPEIRTDLDTELPRINEQYLGRKYRYSYGARYYSNSDNQLLKIDAKEKKILRWELQGHVPGEPVFCAAPDAKEEDDGVVMSPVISYTEDKPCFLLIMDAKSFTELARAHIPKHVRVPFSFHGIFSEKRS